MKIGWKNVTLDRDVDITWLRADHCTGQTACEIFVTGVPGYTSLYLTARIPDRMESLAVAIVV